MYVSSNRGVIRAVAAYISIKFVKPERALKSRTLVGSQKFLSVLARKILAHIALWSSSINKLANSLVSDLDILAFGACNDISFGACPMQIFASGIKSWHMPSAKQNSVFTRFDTNLVYSRCLFWSQPATTWVALHAIMSAAIRLG
ncbi:MAG: hypothetical protein AAJB65_00815 [Candidatus Hodgkinia cicadicola]